MRSKSCQEADSVTFLCWCWCMDVFCSTVSSPPSQLAPHPTSALPRQNCLHCYYPPPPLCPFVLIIPLEAVQTLSQCTQRMQSSKLNVKNTEPSMSAEEQHQVKTLQGLQYIQGNSAWKQASTTGQLFSWCIRVGLTWQAESALAGPGCFWRGLVPELHAWGFAHPAGTQWPWLLPTTGA